MPASARLLPGFLVVSLAIGLAAEDDPLQAQAQAAESALKDQTALLDKRSEETKQIEQETEQIIKAIQTEKLSGPQVQERFRQDVAAGRIPREIADRAWQQVRARVTLDALEKRRANTGVAGPSVDALIGIARGMVTGRDEATAAAGASIWDNQGQRDSLHHAGTGTPFFGSGLPDTDLPADWGDAGSSVDLSTAAAQAAHLSQRFEQLSQRNQAGQTLQERLHRPLAEPPLPTDLRSERAKLQAAKQESDQRQAQLQAQRPQVEARATQAREAYEQLDARWKVGSQAWSALPANVSAEFMAQFKASNPTIEYSTTQEQNGDRITTIYHFVSFDGKTDAQWLAERTAAWTEQNTSRAALDRLDAQIAAARQQLLGIGLQLQANQLRLAENEAAWRRYLALLEQAARLAAQELQRTDTLFKAYQALSEASAALARKLGP